MSTLRREASALVEASLRLCADEFSQKKWSEEFPALGASSKQRIRTRTVPVRSAKGDITHAPGLEAASEVMAAAMTRRLEPRAWLEGRSLVTPKKVAAESSSCARVQDEDVLWWLAVAFTESSSRESLGSSLRVLGNVLSVRPATRVEGAAWLSSGAVGIGFAAASVALLRRELGAIGGAETVRAAALKLAEHSDGLVGTCRSILEEYAERLALLDPGRSPHLVAMSHAREDYSQPFVRERDSRKAFSTDSATRLTFDNRERARDAFLRLLRDFESARSAVDDAALEALIPPEDRPFLYRDVVAPPQRSAGRRGGRRPVWGDDASLRTLRARASSIVRCLLPVNQRWFAELFDATLLRVALAPPLDAEAQQADKLKRLQARLFAEREGPISGLAYDEHFFALFVAGADAALFRNQLLAALSAGIKADLESLSAMDEARAGDTLDRLGVRARIAGFVVCSPHYAPAATTTASDCLAWPPDLDPVDFLKHDDDSLKAAASIFCATNLCRAIKWTPTSRDDSEQLKAARKRFRLIVHGMPNSSRVFSRLELERLFDDLQLTHVDFETETILSALDNATVIRNEMPALSPLFLDRLRSSQDALVHIPALAKHAGYATHIKAVFLANKIPSSSSMPHTATPLKAKLRPFLLVKPTRRDETPPFFAPLADAFFRRYPLMKSAAELALDAAAAHAFARLERHITNQDDHDDVSIALKVAADKIAVLAVFAPPDAPTKLIEIATTLTLDKFRRSVLPDILSKIKQRRSVDHHEADSRADEDASERQSINVLAARQRARTSLCATPGFHPVDDSNATAMNSLSLCNSGTPIFPVSERQSS